MSGTQKTSYDKRKSRKARKARKAREHVSTLARKARKLVDSSNLLLRQIFHKWQLHQLTSIIAWYC